jgi:hypothetical protein
MIKLTFRIIPGRGDGSDPKFLEKKAVLIRKLPRYEGSLMENIAYLSPGQSVLVGFWRNSSQSTRASFGATHVLVDSLDAKYKPTVIPIRINVARVMISTLRLVISVAYYIQMQIYSKVWTSHLLYSKSKPKTTPFKGVIRVQILWLGMSLSTGTL